MLDARPSSFDTARAARLGNRLTDEAQRIVEMWTREVRADPQIHSDDSLSYAEFVDHIPRVVEKVCAVLHGKELEEEGPGIRRVARTHGLFRWRQGYDLGELMREIGHLRQVFLSLVTDLSKEIEIPHGERAALERKVLRVIDEGQVSTILTYVTERDREMAERDRDLAERDREIAERGLRLQQAQLEKERSRVEALESAAAAKDDFLATLSHELRTPLTPILAWIAILEKDRSPVGVDAAVTTIARNAQVLHRLIEDLLDVSRIVADKLELVQEPLDVRQVVHVTRDTVRPAAEARQIRISSSEPGEPLTVLGDAVRLQQVVWNLVSNAIKFSEPGGEVRVLQTREGGTVVIAVEDDGAGIAPDFLPYVFGRFRQQDVRPARGRGGLGLGLAIARSITEAHRGTLTAASAGEGRGSRFEVRLPAAKPPVPSPETPGKG